MKDFLLFQVPVPRALFFKWSPGGDQIVTFHQYYETKDNPNPGPNVLFWSVPEGAKMGGYLHKGAVDGWEPNWTSDSNFIIRKIGEQLMVFSRAEPTKGEFYLVFVIKGATLFMTIKRNFFCI